MPTLPNFKLQNAHTMSDNNEQQKPHDEEHETHRAKGIEETDAGRGEVAIYAFGNVEGAIADRFPETLQNILIVVAHVNPLLLGFIMGIRLFWDGLMDPIMAHISDNSKSRWGRRRPYILVGGVARVLFLVAMIHFMPLGNQISSNKLMEAQKFVNQGVSITSKNFITLAKTYEQLPTATPEIREKMLNMLEGKTPENIITKTLNLFAKEKDNSFLTLSAQAYQDIQENLPTLNEDLQQRQKDLQKRASELAAVQNENLAQNDNKLLRAQGLHNNAISREATAKNLISQAKKAQAKAIAEKYATRYLLATNGRLQGNNPSTPQQAQALATADINAANLEPLDIFTIAPSPAPKPWKKKSAIDNIKDGIKAYSDPANFEQRSLMIYLLMAYLIFATLSTINAAPYYALGIELSPSYHGRTQVVVYRSIMNKIVGLIVPWVPVFCFSLYFTTAFEALYWVTIFCCIIGIPSTILMFFKTRERTRKTATQTENHPNLFKSMWEIGNEREFLRILFLFVFIGLVNGLFAQVGFFLNIYWVTGSALSGAVLGAKIGMLAWGLSFASLPLINWGCRKFQKHRVLQFALIWMSLGTALKWWAMNPEHPEYQFILPFFFSVGIGAVYTVLPTLMADITDLDELKYGLRREGMFGAVMGFLMKLIGTITPIAAGAVLVLSGFDSTLEYQQSPQTIFNLRIMYSFIPATLLLLALLALRKYPITRERVQEIKNQLNARHDTEDEQKA